MIPQDLIGQNFRFEIWLCAMVHSIWKISPTLVTTDSNVSVVVVSDNVVVVPMAGRKVVIRESTSRSLSRHGTKRTGSRQEGVSDTK